MSWFKHEGGIPWEFCVHWWPSVCENCWSQTSFTNGLWVHNQYLVEMVCLSHLQKITQTLYSSRGDLRMIQINIFISIQNSSACKWVKSSKHEVFVCHNMTLHRLQTLKCKCQGLDESFIISCPRNCYFDNLKVSSEWWHNHFLQHNFNSNSYYEQNIEIQTMRLRASGINLAISLT